MKILIMFVGFVVTYILKIVNYTKIYPSEMNDYNIEMNDINELNELKNESNIMDDNSISNMYD